MLSILPNFEYDIFISYRHNDNRSGWVTEFVKALQEELAATIKEPVSVYFDTNPHDGLLETHNVDKSLEGKLKCLIFIPIISQTYCDPKSFAWQHEFCAFNKLANEHAPLSSGEGSGVRSFGRDIKLSNGNVASRILPIKIHDLDVQDRATIENEIGGVLRAIDFIYKEAGVNRPLRSNEENPGKNQNQILYLNQVNKVANAVKEIIHSIKKENASTYSSSAEHVVQPMATRPNVMVIAGMTLILAVASYFLLNKKDIKREDNSNEILDRAEKYLEESSRFNDKRYISTAIEAIRKVLLRDSLNGRAMFLLALAIDKKDTSAYYQRKVFASDPKSIYGYLIQASGNDNLEAALEIAKKAEGIDPQAKDVLGMLAGLSLNSRDYLNAWRYAKKYEQVSGKRIHDFLSQIFLELGDFAEARREMELKRKEEEFSCSDIENYQRIFLCEGNFERLEKITDSICALSKCDDCGYWILRAKMHVGKYQEAYAQMKAALKSNIAIKFRYPAYVLLKVGKMDSAQLILEKEITFDKEKIKDTANRQTLPYYSLSSINALRGNYKESISWLRHYSDKGFAIGSEWYIGHDPLFDELKSNNTYFTDFIQIVQKAQLKKSTLREKLRDLENGKDK